MNSNIQNELVEIEMLKKRRVLRTIKRLQSTAALIVFLTVSVTYFFNLRSNQVFISFPVLVLIQIFATKEYNKLFQIARRVKLLSYGPYATSQFMPVRWTIAAGTAVYKGFFLLLVVFKVSWLLHAFFYPVRADSFDMFLHSLEIGPISGIVLLGFTFLLCIIYSYLLIIGLAHSKSLQSVEQSLHSSQHKGNKLSLQEVWIKVKTFDGEELFLQGHHLNNRGKQPLILWPGFYQNGYVYHLSDDASLARYLWAKGFDIWIIHPRRTAASEGYSRKASLDDFGSDDMPAVIQYVSKKTGIKPVFVGHSQGGISAIISLVGAVKTNAAEVILSDEAMRERQNSLRGVVVLGSFPDFSFSKPSWLKSFVNDGIYFKIAHLKIKLLSSRALLRLLQHKTFVGNPFSFALRMMLLTNRKARILLFPFILILDFIAQRKLWSFLYHLPNVSPINRKILFYKTMDGTFGWILKQFHSAVIRQAMFSMRGEINYSALYSRLALPIVVVAMEYDTLADPEMMQRQMFDKFASKRKAFILWKGVGHEDHFANPVYFAEVHNAILKVL